METLDLNYMLDQMNLTDLYRTFHPTASNIYLFSSIHRTFPRINHRLVHKISFNKFEKLIISDIFSDHNGMKLEINYKKKTGAQLGGSVGWSVVLYTKRLGV